MRRAKPFGHPLTYSPADRIVADAAHPAFTHVREKRQASPPQSLPQNTGTIVMMPFLS